MKAKKVYEAISDILVGKTEEEILAGFTDNAGEYIKRKETSSLKGKRLPNDPFIVKLYYDALDRNIPVKQLHGINGLGQFRIHLIDKDDEYHTLFLTQSNQMWVSGKGDVKMTWAICHDKTEGNIGPLIKGDRTEGCRDFETTVYSIDELEKIYNSY